MVRLAGPWGPSAAARPASLFAAKVGNLRHMRLHIEIEEELVDEIDRVAGSRRRSQFVREAMASALDQRRRWELIRAARGASPTRVTSGTTTRPSGCVVSATPTSASPADPCSSCSDSTVLIDYLRGRPVADRVDALEQTGDVPVTSGVNVEEVVRGLRPEEVDDAESLFLGLRVLPIGRREGWRAGEWRRELGARGGTLSQADCLVAAVARSNQARLATGNLRHFPVDDVIVEHWPVGEQPAETGLVAWPAMSWGQERS